MIQSNPPIIPLTSLLITQDYIMKKNESLTTETKTRRHVLIGISLLSLFSFFTFGFFSKKKNIISCAPIPVENETMKFLSQDGQLVEVAISKITTLREKAAIQELQDWVKR